jgi:hypothetical protein
MNPFFVAVRAAAVTLVACIALTFLLAQSGVLSLGGRDWTVLDFGESRASQLMRLPGLLRNEVTGGSQEVLPARTALSRHARVPPKGSPGASVPRNPTTTRKCVRMEAWGDVCVYSNLCLGDGRLKIITEDVSMEGVTAGGGALHWGGW